MSTRLYEVQTKIYEILTSSLTTRVFDFVPEGTISPYITIGDMSSSNETLADEKITISLDVWSESKGRKECVSILTEIEDALGGNLELLTAIVVQQRVLDRAVVPQQGFYQGTITIEFQIEWL